MNKDSQEEAGLPGDAIILPTVAAPTSFWEARKRRPFFLAILISALTTFLVLLPAGARSALWMGLSAQRGLVLLLVLFALLTLSLVWKAGQRMDARVFLIFNKRSYPTWLDRSMWLITQLGNMLAALLIASLLFIFNYRRMAFEIVFSTLILWLLVETIKLLVDRDRPFHTLDLARVIGRKEKGDSFPSGHTTQIFFMATLIIFRFKLGLGVSIALYAIAALVGFTRIYVGAHYPRDVVAGMVLGSLWSILTILANPY